jgi:DNA repair protein RadC
MPRPRHCHGQRLRARFLAAGPQALADYELIELVLFRAIPQRDVRPSAKDLISRFGSFAEAIGAPVERLREVARLGEAAIVELEIVEAAAARLARGAVAKRQALSSWTSVLDYCRAAMAVRRQEESEFAHRLLYLYNTTFQLHS